MHARSFKRRPLATLERALAVLAGTAALAGCAAGAPVQPSAAPARALPSGAGRRILERECTRCHDLDGLWAYQGYYNEARWREMVETMVGYGARLDEDEAATLTSYLAEHFGPGTRE